MKNAKTNAGRITRPDQAWTAAYREKADRESAPAPIQSRQNSAHRAKPGADSQSPAGTPPEAQTASNPAPSGAIPGPSTASSLPTIHNPTPDAPTEALTASLQAYGPGLAIPLRYISAALLVAPKNDIRYYLCGVFIHAVAGELRICATDGHRLIVSTFRPEVPLPTWAEAGVILNRDQLAQALPIISKNGDQIDAHGDVPLIVDYEPGAPAIVLRSGNAFSAFRLQPVEGKFPEYARVLAAQGSALARGEGDAMRTASINVSYMRGAADIGSKLGARAVNAFIPSEEGQGAAVFTFDGAADTVLIVMPMRGEDDVKVSPSVVRMLGHGGIAASVAALRAHVTRTAKALTTAPAGERSSLEARKASLQERIDALLKSVADQPKALPHREAA